MHTQTILTVWQPAVPGRRPSSQELRRERATWWCGESGSGISHGQRADGHGISSNDSTESSSSNSSHMNDSGGEVRSAAKSPTCPGKKCSTHEQDRSGLSTLVKHLMIRACESVCDGIKVSGGRSGGQGQRDQSA